MAGFGFKIIAFFIVIGVIFGAGALVGSGFAAGSAESSQRARIASCLPVKDVAALDACLAAGDR